nr:integrase, catalytic region, zinc finger, CCHC-type, peptidase aspartic, catalytic [Tanacetum cinerariifolium]
MVRFGDNDFAVIAGYGDVVIGSMTIKKVYYVKGLGHNLFSVGQFCNKGLASILHSSLLCDCVITFPSIGIKIHGVDCLDLCLFDFWVGTDLVTPAGTDLVTPAGTDLVYPAGT